MVLLLALLLLIPAAALLVPGGLQPAQAAPGAFSDEFSTDTLDSGWTWLDPLGDCSYSLTANPGYLRVSVPDGGHDMWPGFNYNSPRVTQPVAGDFTIETRVLFDPQYHAQHAGLLVWKDADNFLRLERRYSNDGQAVVICADVGGTGTIQQAIFSETTTYLRMVRQGNVFSSYYSSDGINWSLLADTTMAVVDPVEVGLMMVNSWQDNPTYADFDYFRFQQSAPTVTSIDPASGTNESVVSVTDLAGTGFIDGATVSLKKLGQADIAATNVMVVSDTSITCDFDLTGTATGTWDVVVTNPDTHEGVLSFGFRVSLGWGSLAAWGYNGYGQCDVPTGNDFIAVAGGENYGLALRSDGSLAAWGGRGNDYGQCTVPAGNDFVAIAAGYYHGLALRSDGSLRAWGFNLWGQCDVPSGNDFVAVAAGGNHSLALRSDGSLTAWGVGWYGLNTVPAGNDFVAISAGVSHSLALRSDGSIAAWGDISSGQCTVPAPNSGFTAVAAGGFHSLALRSDGSLAAWGLNDYGQVSSLPAGNDFVAVSAGGSHSLALRSDRSIAGWGYNEYGQATPPAGNDFTAVAGGFYHSLAIVQHPAPTVTSINPASGTNEGAVSVTDLAGTGFRTGATVSLQKLGQADIAATNVVVTSTKITCDLDLTGAATGTWDVVVTNPDTQEGVLPFGFRVQLSSGSLSAWGYNFYHECDVLAGNDFIAVSGGGWHSLALRSNGSIAGWGYNGWLQCNVPAGTDFVAVSAGGNHSLALRSDGSIAGWGYNEYGQATPPAGNDYVAIAAGSSYSLALRSDGSLAAWGDSPTGLPTSNDFVAVSAGDGYGLGLRSDGSIAGWGFNTSGQATPPAGNDYVAIAAGSSHSLALKADGSLAAWGDNYYGQNIVPAGNDFTAVSEGGGHSLALRSDGSLAGWGFNDYGQCDVPAGNDFAAISGGGWHSLAIVQHPAPTVISIDPASGTNEGTVSVTDLAGSGFLDGATVSLKKLGQADIAATNVVVTGTKITCDFDLTGASTGTWDVVVTNPDTQEGTLAGGFTVYQDPFSDEFSGGTLDPGWTWTDPLADSSYSLTANPGYLRVSVPGDGHDLSPSNYNAPRVTQVTGGGFTIETKVLFDPQASFQSAGILAWADSDNFLRLERFCYVGSQVVYLGGEVGGSWTATYVPFTTTTTYLRLVRVGDVFSSYYSSDGTDWTLLTDTTMAVTDPVEVGLHVLDQGNNNPVSADFDYFRCNRHFVNASVSGGHGMVNPTSQVVARGGSATVNLNPDAHYHVASVTDNGSTVTPTPSGSYTINPVTDNHNVVVTYAIDTYTLSTGQVGSGSVSKNPSQSTYDYGTSVELRATPAAGYHFVEWTGDLTGTTNPANLTMDANKTAIAHFAIDTFDITASADPPAGGSITGAGTYNHGDTVDLSASHAANYHFVNWTEGASVVSTSADYSFTATAARTLVAHFTLNTYAVNASVTGGHGTVTETTQTVAQGGTATIHINPDANYHIASITDNGATKAIANPYVITNVTAAHTVVVTFAQDQQPDATRYLPEGSTNWGFDCYVSIANPNDEAVHAKLTYMTSAGPVTGPTVAMPARSQATVYPSSTLGAADFSTKVECLEGKIISVDRTMYWTGTGAPCPEAHCATGVTSPATTWYLPEGSSAWGFECFLLIQNPNASAANCTVTWMIEGQAPVESNQTVGANSRSTMNMADFIGQKDASIKVVSNIPVIPERAMYRNNRREGHDSTGTAQAASDYYLAEGCAGFGFTTYVLVQNPQGTPTDVTITYQAASGPVQGPSFQMPANSRKTINVNDTTTIPGADPSFSTKVHGSAPIIAERAMYWNGGPDNAQVCHDSIGLDRPYTNWYLADGQSSEGRETWTLVQNPNDTPVTVEVTYLTPNGTGNVTKTETIAASSRKSFNMADHSGITGRAAIMVTSKTAGKKVMVERAMYWNNRGTGTDTIGGYSD